MQTTNEPESDPDRRGPLVLHIRRLRQWHGEHGLTQGELAKLAGISPRLLRGYEACRSLPTPLGTLLAIATALGVPLEAIIDPRIRERLRTAIDERRNRITRKRFRTDDSCV